MEKIKEICKSSVFIDLLIICIIMILFSILFSQHQLVLFSDKGREFLLPEAIMNGAVPYKDITLIYFPLSYYINALLYKIFGVYFNTLILFHCVLSLLFIFIYYLIAREFLPRKTSLLLSLLIISSCIFSVNDLFNYITPYSYARVHGVIGSFACIFCIIQLFKTDKIKFAYLAGLLSGFVLSCKIEFLTVAIILFAGLFLYKKLNQAQYLKVIGCYFVFPVLTLSILFFQGVTIQDLLSGIKFAISFSTTEAMRTFLKGTGMSPISINPSSLLSYSIKFITVLSMCALTIFLDEKYKNKFILPVMGLISLGVCFWLGNTENYWVELPILLLILSVCFVKSITKEKRMLFLCIAAFILCQREFFKVCLIEYGTYSFPILMLYFCSLINHVINKEELKIFIQRTLNLLFAIIIIFNINGLFNLRNTTDIKLITNRGNIYINYDRFIPLVQLSYYFKEEQDNSSSLLVLPEGVIINYILNKEPNYHYFMMDRLYHDAYGEEKARDIIKDLNSDYIVLIQDFDLNNFGYPYLYDKEQTLSGKYIHENYNEVLKLQTDGSDTILQLLKRKI